ncbi:hypothetical protein Cgig2_030117 [Carnegiea gigantea]|uniref:Retrotransposon gag domain-containing protein n=1 Tax=Carnegiea gigantea TaxID=171969 RepID=A0A9Q1K4M7_9CARY|nr:hypothetical protein Cgig2_030117 [Carnegiea gigantea]
MEAINGNWTLKSIPYIQAASAVWLHLQKRLSLSQGSRKYKLIKDVYSVKQDDTSVSDYYTLMRGIWEELDAMNELPRITTVGEDITQFLNALLKQLLSVSKLVKDNDCMVTFYHRCYAVHDLCTKIVKGVGREQGELCYLSDASVQEQWPIAYDVQDTGSKSRRSLKHANKAIYQGKKEARLDD